MRMGIFDIGIWEMGLGECLFYKIMELKREII